LLSEETQDSGTSGTRTVSQIPPNRRLWLWSGLIIAEKFSMGTPVILELLLFIPIWMVGFEVSFFAFCYKATAKKLPMG